MVECGPCGEHGAKHASRAVGRSCTDPWRRRQDAHRVLLESGTRRHQRDARGLSPASCPHAPTYCAPLVCTICREAVSVAVHRGDARARLEEHHPTVCFCRGGAAAAGAARLPCATARTMGRGERRGRRLLMVATPHRVPPQARDVFVAARAILGETAADDLVELRRTAGARERPGRRLRAPRERRPRLPQKGGAPATSS